MVFRSRMSRTRWGVVPWSFHDPQRVAGRIPQPLIRDPSAEEPFRPVRTLTTDQDCPIVSGPRLIEDSLCDIVFVAELQRDTIQRKSSFSEQLQRLHPNRVFHHAFLLHPVLLILLQLRGQANLFSGTFRSVMFKSSLGIGLSM